MATYDSERRTVLHGMAVLALALAGCQKKAVSPAPKTQAPEAAVPAAPAPSHEAGPTPGSGGASQGGSADGAPAPGGKLSKTQAGYQDQPKGDQQCANCMHFIAESGTCQVVEGKVSPNGWCTLWANKQG